MVFVSARGGNGSLSFNGQGGGKAASGSGFVIDTAGHIVTNDHVVENADRFTVRFGETGDPIPAKLVGKDPSSDLAVLSIDPKDVKGGVKPLQLASSKSLRPGRGRDRHRQPVRPLGHRHDRHHLRARPRDRGAQRLLDPRRRADRRRHQPRQLGRPAARRRRPRDRRQLADRLRRSGGNTGVGFAVPVDSIRDVIPKLVKDGHIDRAYLGLASGEQPATPGALVGTVNPGTPAADAGIRTGDLIVGFDGKTIRNPSELSLAVLAEAAWRRR